MLARIALLRKQRRRRAGPADQTAHVRGKRQFVPGAADIESKFRDFLPRLGLAGPWHGHGMQIEPAFAEVYGAAKTKSESRVFELAFLDAGYSLNEPQTETGTLESGPAAMNIGEKRKRAFVDPVQDGIKIDPSELPLRDVNLRRPVEVTHKFAHAGPGAFEIGPPGQDPVKFRPSEGIERQGGEVGAGDGAGRLHADAVVAHIECCAALDRALIRLGPGKGQFHTAAVAHQRKGGILDLKNRKMHVRHRYAEIKIGGAIFL